ncbi:MAG: hypothetical protein V1793_11855 [Pseudomonadota bacterium]
MTHEDAGHYAKKHQGTQADPKIGSALKKRSDKGTISCAAVHAVAKELGISPDEAGVQADLLELRLIDCSLGLFGYGDDKNKPAPMAAVPQPLDQALDKASKNGRVSCLECWTIARELNLNRKDVTSACETKKLKIKPCQLGAFK